MKKEKIVERPLNVKSWRKKLFEMLSTCPIPKEELLENLALFICKADLSSMLYIHELYRKLSTV